MPRSSLEAFSLLWRAYGEGRLGDSLDLIDPDCEITYADGSSALRGHDGVRARLADARRDWRMVRIVHDDVFEDHPGCVVGSGHLTASATGGAHVNRPIAFVAEFRDGRLVRGRVFDTRDDAVEAAKALRCLNGGGA
jgi:ketosteroid isomerase-like protein